MAGLRSVADIVSEAVRGGCTMVQLREKELSTREFLAEAQKLKEVLSGTGVPLIINDRVDIALAVGADGVHLGQRDMPYEEARRLLGRDKIIGLSVENMTDVEQANLLDVDYIGISPMFATSTKHDTAQPFGIEGARKAVHHSVHPCVAIGGITSENAHLVRETGVQGVAVVSAIMASPDPCAAARQLRM